MTQAKNLRRNTLRENHCSGVLADHPLSKGGHGISTGLRNRRWCTENKTFAGRNLISIKVITDGMLSWLHFSPCCMYNSGYKSLEKNKVRGLTWRSLVTLCLFLYLFIYLSSFADVIHPEDMPGLCWGWTSAPAPFSQEWLLFSGRCLRWCTSKCICTKLSSELGNQISLDVQFSFESYTIW